MSRMKAVLFEPWFPALTVARPDMRSTLTALRKAGLRLGVITNGSVRMQSAKMEHLGLERYVSHILISEAVGSLSNLVKSVSGAGEIALCPQFQKVRPTITGIRYSVLAYTWPNEALGRRKGQAGYAVAQRHP